MPPVKRIGLVDYSLDNFHARVYLELLREQLRERGYQVAGAFALVEETSRRWAAERDLPYFSSVEALAREVDCFMILAPSNPETHWDLCSRVFPHGKITFVDKTFAPDLATAERIFALADQHGIEIQTTSALRSSTVQQSLSDDPVDLQSMYITASGTSFAEYGIHPLELAVSCLGGELEQVMQLGPRDHPLILLRFSGERTAVIDFHVEAELPFQAVLVSDAESRTVTVEGNRLFLDAAASILDFFDAGRALVDRRESLVIRAALDRLAETSSTGKFVDILSAVPDSALRGPHWASHLKRPRYGTTPSN